MSEIQKKAVALENQLSDLIMLLGQPEVTEKSDVGEVRGSLMKHLATLRTDLQQLSDTDKANFFPGNPIFDDNRRRLALEINQIGVALEFDINPKVELVVEQLATQAQKEAGAGDKNILEKALEWADKALKTVGEPLAKAAALATAIKTLVEFFKTRPM